jgi:ribonuclease HIII
LVVASVFIKKENYINLNKKGITDSKKINDSRIPVLSQIIKKECHFETLLIGPKKYNELYAKFQNLNNLLSWAHLKCLKNLTEKVNAKNALLDRFCSEEKIIQLAKKMNININLKTEVRGEHDMAVAAASILARNIFLTQMQKLSEHYKIELPKGGGDATIKTGRQFIEKYGFDELSCIAKIHFKNTDKLKT